jgi:glycine/D-amino acid oxidase-like deaminating enzyme/nitrite reductase/ring-hydroxylating ferredoxin subunit
MGTQSVWHATSSLPRLAPLPGDLATDVCVVGAGVAGMSAAYELACAGKRVVVLERGEIGSGETGRTTAHLVTAFDDRLFEIAERLGEENARILVESHAAAIARAAEIAEHERAASAFEWRDGWLILAPGFERDHLEKELAAAHRAGLTDVRLECAPQLDAFGQGLGLCFPHQLQLDPLPYLSALAGAIERNGGRIFGSTHVDAVEDGSPARVVTARGPLVRAADVVVATNTPFVDRVKIHTKQAAYRTYVVALRIASAAFPRVLLWETGWPYHYVRTHTLPDGSELLIVGGEDHKTGQAQDGALRLERLEAWARERVPAGETLYRWSGQVMEPVDGVAFIGRNPGDEHVFVATGDSGNGMTHGILGGLLLRDLILGRQPAWAKTYDPARKPLTSLASWAKENLNTAAQYAEWVTPAELPRTDALARRAGAIVRGAARKIAAHRDASGELHTLSAVCPHLGAIVSWNALEQSWDCPAHGSRFSVDGSVLNGPAHQALTRVRT